MTASQKKRYSFLVDEIERDFKQYKRNGFVKNVERINKEAGRKVFEPNCWPHYYAGDLDSKIVTVQLNPHFVPDPAYQARKRFGGLDDYLNRFSGFNQDSDTISSFGKFDHNFVRFFKGFKELDLSDGTSEDMILQSLKTVTGKKLQLELVPYGSPGWKVGKMDASLLMENFERLLRVITARKRDYVLFCGNVFTKLLKQSAFRVELADDQPEPMYLLKVKGGFSTKTARIINIQVTHGKGSFNASILPTFPQQGLNYFAYGEYCKNHCRKASE